MTIECYLKNYDTNMCNKNCPLMNECISLAEKEKIKPHFKSKNKEPKIKNKNKHRY